MRKQCKRKVWALVNPLLHAIEGAAITPEHALEGLRLRELAAIEAFAKGQADIDAWSDINLMNGICETMARAGIGKAEVAATCEAVTQALQDADVVVFVHRPIQDRPDLGLEWQHYAKLNVAKNRNGRCGHMSLHYEGPQTRFDAWHGEPPRMAARGGRGADL